MKRTSLWALLAATALGCGELPSETLCTARAPLGATTQDETEIFGIDADFVEAARKEPTFGGLYLESNQLVLVLTDVSRLDSALEAVLQVFGTERFERNLPARGVEGQYNSLELVGWKHALKDVFMFGSVTSLDADEFRNRVAIGIVDLEAVPQVESHISAVGVPREAVVFDERDFVQPLAPDC
ncbi:MAG: hypothetical protein L0Y66_14495 [Myxococcaceae bacterium]|nr:hypothetical protein [Myxococcaceae bacterium]